MNPLYVLLEIAAGSLFAFAAWTALRRGRLPFLQLASAAGFGLLLEEGDQLIFETYHYNPDFVLALDRAPVAIGLTWALILIGAMRLTDALGVRRRYAPFVDSVLAISLDLAFDAVAIRMGLWTWRDTPLTEAWFGVPAGNFYTWLIIVFGFTLLSRWLADEARTRPSLDWFQLGVPVPAFAIVLTGLIPFILLKPTVDPSPGGGMVMFVVTLAGFVGLAAYGVWMPERGLTARTPPPIDEVRLALAVRLAIHGFFLAALLVIGLAVQHPVLLVISTSLLLAELPLARLVAFRQARAEATPALEAAAGAPAPSTVAG
jgi:hypothetical protein